MLSDQGKLQFGHFYHIYNRGINSTNLFLEQEDYNGFLERLKKYITPIAKVYAYCLLKNHFHLLVKIQTEDHLENTIKEWRTFSASRRENFPSRQFSHFFSSHTQSINFKYSRTGTLFEQPFHRIAIEQESHFTRLIQYIHHNPQSHLLTNNFEKWPHSSFKALCSDTKTLLERNEIWEWFGGKRNFIAFHQQSTTLNLPDNLLLD